VEFIHKAFLGPLLDNTCKEKIWYLLMWFEGILHLIKAQVKLQ